MTGMVDGLQGHASGQSAITDNCHTFVGMALVISRQGHTQGCRNAGGGMPCTKVIKPTLTALEITGDTILLTERVEIDVTTSDQLVGVSLVAHIPHHPVLIQIKGLVERQGELHDPKARPEVTTTGGNSFKMLFADLPGNGFQLRHTQPVQLIGMSQLAEMHPAAVP